MSIINRPHDRRQSTLTIIGIRPGRSGSVVVFVVPGLIVVVVVVVVTGLIVGKTLVGVVTPRAGPVISLSEVMSEL